MKKSHTSRNQAGFGLLGVLVLLLVLSAIGASTWYFLKAKPLSSTTADTSDTSVTHAASTQTLAAMIADLQQQLPAQFSYLTDAEITDTPLATNLLTDNSWYITAPSKDTSLHFSFEGSSSGIFNRLPASQQQDLDSQTKDVISYVVNVLETNDYHYRAAPKAGVVFANDKAGYYASADSQCLLLHWHSLPIPFELSCATVADIKTAQMSAAPLIEAFVKAHPERSLNTVVVSPPAIEPSTSGVQYALLSISAPDSINTHPTDGPSIWARQGQTWRELSSDASVCESSTLQADLARLSISDTTAAEAVNKLCAKIGP